MSGQPLRDRWNMAPDLIELDDAQRLVRPVVLQQGLKTLRSRQVLERQRALATVVTPQHPIGVPGAVVLGMDACHNPRCYANCYVDPDVTSKLTYDLLKCSGAKGVWS